jgi:hypothetical protein
MHYCEQLSTQGAFEPLNAVTNLAFLLAAAWGWRALRAVPRRLPAGPRTLPLLAAAIALGSFAWHATGARWAELADVLPIAGFVLVFLASALRGVVGVGAAVSLGACCALLAACVAAAIVAGDNLNGSAAYLPVLAGLCGLGLACRNRDRAAARGFALAAVLFTVSLAFRTMDLGTCALTGVGTHWLWHLLNALLLARLMTLLARHHRDARRPGQGD